MRADVGRGHEPGTRCCPRAAVRAAGDRSVVRAGARGRALGVDVARGVCTLGHGEGEPTPERQSVGFAYGDALNLGHGAGTGRDRHGRAEPPSTAKLTIGDTTVAGTLPPEIIRRIPQPDSGTVDVVYRMKLTRK
jgi:hypothetical protein